MKRHQTNYFNLDKPDEWHCQLWSYGVGHSEMQVRIYNPEGKYYRDLYFISVDFFSGPMSWVGANFKILSNEECLEVLRQTTVYDHLTDQSLIEDNVLFSVDVKNSRLEQISVKIVAAPVSHVSDYTYQVP